jgi:hypothetical protein
MERTAMDLKSHDLLVLFKRIARPDEPLTYASMGESLRLSASQVHRSVQRCLHAGLAVSRSRNEWQAVRGAVLEFSVHGVRYAFPAVIGPAKRGIPTSFGVAPLSKSINADASEIPVWPHPQGKVRGPSVSPICPTAPDAALEDSVLHGLLALLDALRIGRARERDIAAKLLEDALR